MCPLHNNYVGENTPCPTCARIEAAPREPTKGEAVIMRVLSARNNQIAEMRDKMRMDSYFHNIMTWAAAIGWGCLVLVLAFGDKL